MSNVTIQELSTTLIEAIREQDNAVKVLYLSKGSSEYLYVIIHEHEGKEVYNIVTYGKKRIRDYLKEFYSKEQISYFERNGFDKLLLFIETLFSEYGLDSIEVDGNKLSLGDDVDEFLKSIS